MNHISLIDICVLLSVLGDAVCVVKAAAKRNPFLGVAVRKLFIANDTGVEETLAKGQALLESGVDVVIFPQGTRNGVKWQRGAARLALATGATIALYHIAYDPVVLAKGQPWWDVGDKVIRITLTEKGLLSPSGPNDHKNAVALTARLKELVNA